jgi:hypothetical protein
MFVPVVDEKHKPLMPTTAARARRWIKSGKATPFWKQGIFCVRLNVEPSDSNIQPIAVASTQAPKKRVTALYPPPTRTSTCRLILWTGSPRR